MPSRDELSSSDFADAFQKTVDEVKPDQLVKKQLDEWTMQWSSSNDDDASQRLDASATDGIVGSLTVTGHYKFVAVHLIATCWWNQDVLSIDCTTKAEFKTVEMDKTDKKMKTRLEKDDYISTLLCKDPVELFVARIFQSSNELEERVDCNEDVGEAVRRVLLPGAESALDIFEIVVRFPFLPASRTDLAKRATLRLLEDAMCNECEKEGEELLLSDLAVKGGDEETARKKQKA